MNEPGREVFEKLSPFIKEYIYRHNWNELREIQIKACDVIFNTQDHLLLASGTASGKTEAAFLPILTDLTNNPSFSVGVLYIAPIKALINDQFQRLNGLLEEADILAWKWHGDVSVTSKTKLMSKPSGILQITPESLESLMINRLNDVENLFADLRYIVIDEVHSFMGTDRGIQVICLLERLQRLTGIIPRRIGLSATLGDYSAAERWLSSGTGIPVKTPVMSKTGMKMRLSCEHFYAPETDVCTDSFWEYIYKKSFNRKCIIFTNLRNQAETSIAMLRELAAENGTPDNFYVHHGSISVSLREEAEREMKNDDKPCVTAATVTLEMGIDIGRLERIIQLEAPWSVSSFLQRLGRSGRRGNPPEMFFVTREDSTRWNVLPSKVPWKLLQIIAVTQLYIEEKWVEPGFEIKYPFSLLYHQLISIMMCYGMLSPKELAASVLSLSAFSYITQEDFRILLLYLIDIGHLQFTEEKELVLTPESEKLAGNFKFYAVFPEDESYSVIFESKEVGTVDEPPNIGEKMTLAGRNWEVVSVDYKQKKIGVVKVKGQIKTYWNTGNSKIHNKILEMMENILQTDKTYMFLQPDAAKRLSAARNFADQCGFCRYNILHIDRYLYCILPWIGNVDFFILKKIIILFLADTFDLKDFGGWSPYYLSFKGKEVDVKNFHEALLRILSMLAANKKILSEMLSDDDVIEMKKEFEYKTPKFDNFIPPVLLRKSLMEDYFNIDYLLSKVRMWNLPIVQ